MARMERISTHWRCVIILFANQRAFQELQDWDLLDTEAGNRVGAEFTFDGLIKRIDAAGFWVFAAREAQVLAGGMESRPQPFMTLIENYD